MTENQPPPIKPSARTKTRNLPKKGAVKRKTLQNGGEDEQFIINEIVFATIPGYAPWPAYRIDIQGFTYFVRFFGTDEM